MINVKHSGIMADSSRRIILVSDLGSGVCFALYHMTLGNLLDLFNHILVSEFKIKITILNEQG